MKKIAIEEHFFTDEYANYMRSRKDPPKLEFAEDENHNKFENLYWTSSLIMKLPGELTARLLETGEKRLKIMDENDIAMQVLSLTSPGVEEFDIPESIMMARKTNDELAGIIRKHPERFAGFAALPLQSPDIAAGELERAVKELGFKGALINSHVKGEYLDNQKYWIIFEMAEKLGVPVYLHPRSPAPYMLKPYMNYDGLGYAIWGFAADVGLHAMCLICSGVFDKFPGLKIILGHLGEGLPYWLWRMDNMWGKYPVSEKTGKKPGQYIRDNFIMTTSGMCWEPVLQFACSAVGVDNILFAVDYPYESHHTAVEFIESVPVSESDREKICHMNAEKLLAL